MNARIIGALVLLAILLVFIFMNLEEARVWFFGVRAQMPIALVVLISGALGLGAGFLLAFVRKPGAKKDAKPAA
jgi:uncharacterized integral membrane protein